MTQQKKLGTTLKENLRIGEDVWRGLFDPHKSKARTRLTTALIIVFQASGWEIYRSTSGGFYAPPQIVFFSCAHSILYVYTVRV